MLGSACTRQIIRDTDGATQASWFTLHQILTILATATVLPTVQEHGQSIFYPILTNLNWKSSKSTSNYFFLELNNVLLKHAGLHYVLPLAVHTL